MLCQLVFCIYLLCQSGFYAPHALESVQTPKMLLQVLNLFENAQFHQIQYIHSNTTHDIVHTAKCDNSKWSGSWFFVQADSLFYVKMGMYPRTWFRECLI